MVEMKELYKYIQIVLHLCCIITIFSIAICEMKYISYYYNKDLVLTSEIEGYNFTYVCSIMNILNTIFLSWVLLDKNNVKIISYTIMLFVINLIIGFWAVSLYCNLRIFGRFNDIIIIQFDLFLIECLILIIFIIFSFYKYHNNFNENNTNYDILPEPNIKDITKDNNK